MDIKIELTAYDKTWGKTVVYAYLSITNQPPIITSDYNLTRCARKGK